MIYEIKNGGIVDINFDTVDFLYSNKKENLIRFDKKQHFSFSMWGYSQPQSEVVTFKDKKEYDRFEYDYRQYFKSRDKK